MSRCASFWHKFENEGNFCGMDPTEISRVKAYLEFVSKLEKTGLDRDLIFTHFTVGSARPLISVNDDDTRVKGLNYVAGCLKRKEKITAGELRNSIKVWLENENKVCPLNARSENLENSKIQAQPEPEIKKEPQIVNTGFAPVPGSIPVTDLPPQPSLAAQMNLSALPPLSPDADWEEKLKRDNLLLEMAKNGDNGGFVPASTLINGGLVTKPAPYKIVPEPLPEPEADNYIMQVVTRRFTPKSKEIWDKILNSGEMSDTPARLFEDIVCRVGGE